MGAFNTSLLLFGIIGVFSVALTEIVRLAAHKTGFVSKPSGNRWNSRAVALGGGVAINLSLIAGVIWLDSTLITGFAPALIAVFILGLVDDVFGVLPTGKLLVQTLAAAYVVGQGYLLPVPWTVPAIALTILWIVGMSNSLNLLDNMDGLAAGASVVAALGFAFLLRRQGDYLHGLLAIALAASAAGFLVHNFYPAKIFMGDAGSLSLGFTLAVVATKLRFQNDVSNLYTLLPIGLLLVVPLFDTALVMVARKNAKRPLMSGGRDHSSHRLVHLGLSERRAVLVLYLLGFVGFAAARTVVTGTFTTFVVISLASAVLMTLFGIFLLETVVYPAVKPELRKTGEKLPKQATLPLPILYLLELTLDIGTISLAWTMAHWVRFQDQHLETWYHAFAVVPTLPYLIAAKLLAFSVFKLYRGLWRTILIQDVYRIFKAVTLGTLLFIVGSALVNRLLDVSRIVLLLDWSLTFLLILGTRTALSAMRRWSRRLAEQPYKAALLGTQTLGPAVKAALEREPGIVFSGIISTDGTDDGRPAEAGVLGPAEQLERVVAERNIDILIVATDQFQDALAAVAAKGIMIREVRIQLA